MGFLDRLNKIVTGAGGALQAPFGLVYDFARAPFVDDEDLDGFWHTLSSRLPARSGQLFGNLFGPEEGVGAAIGGLPGAVREPAGAVIGPVITGLETVGREAFREPLTTLMTMGSLADSDTYGKGWGAFFDGDSWAQAYDIAQDRSFGQSVALAFGTKDILDTKEVNEFVATDAYNLVSGTTDAFIRLYSEVVATKGVSAVPTLARGSRTLGTFTAVEPPQIGGRLSSLGITAPRIERVNETLRSAYTALPPSLQRIVGTPDIKTAADVPRLEALEVAQMERDASRLIEAGGQRAAVGQSMLARAERIRTGQVTSQIRTRAADRLQADIDHYVSMPQRARTARGFLQQQGWADTQEWIESVADDLTEQRRFVLASTRDERRELRTTLKELKGQMDEGLITPEDYRNMAGPVEARRGELSAQLHGLDAGNRKATLAGIIRDRMFPNHPQGDLISHFLATAKTPHERDLLMRLFLGDMRAMNAIRASNVSLASRLEELLYEQAAIKSQPIMDFAQAASTPDPANPNQMSLLDIESPLQDDFYSSIDRLEGVRAQIDTLVKEQDRNLRLQAAFKSLPQGPGMGAGARLRDRIKSSTLYQDSVFGNAVRLITDMRPHHIVDVHDTHADAQLARMLREAGFDDLDIARWRGRFMAEVPDRRGQVFEFAIDAVEKRLMREYGLDADEIQQVVAEAAKGRAAVTRLIQSARYDGEGRALVEWGESGELAQLPLYLTQLQNIVPVTNFRELRHRLDRYARLKYGTDFRSKISRGTRVASEGKEILGEALTDIMGVWKVGVLLRPAWTMRVVGDEQMRQLAKFGTLATLLTKRQETNNYMLRLMDQHPRLRSTLLGSGSRGGNIGRSIAAGLVGGVAAGPLGAAATATTEFKLMKAMAKMEAGGVQNIKLGPWAVRPEFGLPGESADLYRNLASAGAAVDDYFNTWENRIVKNLRRDPYSWRSRVWGTSEMENQLYRTEWAYIMRDHITNDRMTRQFLEGKSVSQVVDWLENTVEGRRYASRLPWRSDTEAWVQAVAAQVNTYTGHSADVAEQLLRTNGAGQQTFDRILDQIPEDQRPVIHAREFEQVIGRSHINRAINEFVNQTFDVLGTAATDEWSRLPTFRRFYSAEMSRKLGNIAPGKLDTRELRSMENQARQYALREVRTVLYDLAERSEFAEMTRLLMPFFPAWQEVLTRWAGLVAERPEVAIYARNVFNAPNKAGWVTEDEQGQEFITFRIPSFAKALVNQGVLRGALDAQGYVRIDKRGLNLVAQGTPGFGPFVQYGVSELVRQQPTMEEAVRFVIPFGPVGAVDAFLPPAAKRALSLNQNEENRAFASAQARILQTRLVDMAAGKIPQVDWSDPVARDEFLDGVNKEARAFFGLRLFSAYVAPVAPIWDSPYKPYIDVYRSLRSGDFARARGLAEMIDPAAAAAIPGDLPAQFDGDADAIFLDTFGEEFFALTVAFTKSHNGVPPTLEGLGAQDSFGDLITRYPEWGSVVAGYTAGGETAKFSRAVYDRQLESGERTRLTPTELVESSDANLGWMKYSRYMDLLEAVRVQQGLPNFEVKAAEPLRNIKRAVIAKLGQMHPKWLMEFSTTDQLAWSRRIEGAVALTQDENLLGRPDIQGLRDYITLRDQVIAVLLSRPTSSIDAQGNVDVRAFWDTSVARLVERNPAFADLYYRKLEHDPLDPNTLSALAGR